MKFQNFIGNTEVKNQISYLIDSGHLPHAIILEGEIGTGKRTFARMIAKALVCTSDCGKPCGICPACKKAKALSHPDIYEFSAKTTPRSFPIDEVRKIRNDVYVKPNEADYKIYILGNGSSMGREAQNALLKTLEEPPRDTIIIITAVSAASLLETVLSRCAVFNISEVSPNEAKEYIASLMPEQECFVVEQACQAWHGNIGRAIESISDGKMKACISTADEICRAAAKKDEYALIAAIGGMESDRENIKSTLNIASALLRDAMLICAGGKAFASNQKETSAKIAQSVDIKQILKMLKAVGNAEVMLGRNANNSLLTSKLCVDLFLAVN